MRLLGLVPPGPLEPHCRYALQELMRRLGVSRHIASWGGDGPSAEGFDGVLVYGPAGTAGLPEAAKPTVHILASGFFGEAFESGASVPRLGPQGLGQAPPLFVAADAAPERQGRVARVHEDWVASAYFFLAGHEERVLPAWDEHGRFDGLRSLPARAGFLGRPIVEDYAERIREAFGRVGLAIPPRAPWPGGAPFAALLTSDVDLPRRNTWRAAASRLLGRQPNPGRDRMPGNGMLSLIPRGEDKDPYFANLRRIAQTSAERPSVQTFFFLSGRRTRLDPYDLGADRAVAREAVRLARDGREIALHASYDCWLNADDYVRALDSFEAATGMRPRGVRQHYLRFRCPQTWRAQAEAGLAYDASAGFSAYEGFRFATSLPFQAFDAERGQTLALWIVPLVAMDTTLRAQRDLRPEEARERLLDLTAQARRVGGAVSLLWHNSSTGGDWGGWEEVFDTFLAHLAEQKAWAPSVAQFLETWKRMADPDENA